MSKEKNGTVDTYHKTFPKLLKNKGWTACIHKLLLLGFISFQRIAQLF